VDDFFPVKYGRPIFTTSKNQDIWVMVLEKAWAKIFGSYSKIEAGLPRYETFLLEY
jgi:calpain-15